MIDLLLPDVTSYGVLKAFTRGLAEGIKNQGVPARIIDLNVKEDVQAHFNNPPSFTFAFNGLLPDPAGRFLYDFSGIPHVAWLLDAPYRFIGLMNHPSTVIITVDEEYKKEAEEYHSKVYFLPHAIDSRHTYDLDKKRKYPIILPGSWKDFGNPEDQEETAARKRIVHLLKGLPVTLFGYGSEGREAPTEGTKEWEEMLKIFEETQIVLNVTPKIKSGGHERIFEAISAGALPISTPNRYLEKEFANGGLEIYDESTLRERIEAILADEPARLAKAKEAQKIVFDKHTWNHRARALLDIAAKEKLI